MKYKIKVFCLYCCLLFSSLAIGLTTIDSSVRSTLSLKEEKKIGDCWLRILYGQNLISEDYLIQDYLKTIVVKLTSSFENSEYAYKVFFIDDPEINAFAWLGGHLAVLQGLINLCQTEDELAAVMAHEIAHIKQHHLINQLIEERKLLPLTIASALVTSLLGAPELMLPILQGKEHQMLKFSRTQEQEADNIGMQILTHSHFNQHALYNIFSKMQRYYGSIKAPEYLLTHPLFNQRLAYAQERALHHSYIPNKADCNFDFIKARIHKFDTKPQANSKDDKDVFLQACYYRKKQNHTIALNLLNSLATKYTNNIIIQLTLADVEIHLNKHALAIERLEKINSNFPAKKAIVMQLADALLISGKAQKANLLLEQNKSILENDPNMHHMLAKSYSMLKNTTKMYACLAEWHFRKNELTQALMQLEYAVNSTKNTSLKNKLEARAKEMQNDSKT